MHVDDRSTAEWLDVRLSYVNLEDQPVEVTYRGKMPQGLEAKRNSSTMGHSAGTVAAVIDLSHKSFAQDATITIGGERQRLVWLLGIVPFRLALAQSQGGFSVGDLEVAADGDGVVTVHAGGHAQAWRVYEVPGAVELVQEGEVRQLRYRFLGGRDESMELVSARVSQYRQGADPCTVTFSPALPDVRRRFAGTVEGRFVIDVNGQASHGSGTWTARWEGDAAIVELRPSAPRWLADRPMRSTVTSVGSSWRVVVQRTD